VRIVTSASMLKCLGFLSVVLDCCFVGHTDVAAGVMPRVAALYIESRQPSPRKPSMMTSRNISRREPLLLANSLLPRGGVRGFEQHT